VFLTFSISLFGLCIYWWRNRRDKSNWLRRLLLSLLGLAVTSEEKRKLLLKTLDALGLGFDS